MTHASALIVTDIEGCINRDEVTYDHENIAKLREWVGRSSRDGSSLPGLALCSGRQYPFVEAISAMLSLRLPSIFENGAGMFWPRKPLNARVLVHPIVEIYNWGGFERRELAITLASQSSSVVEFGKDFIITLHPASGVTPVELRKTVQALLDEMMVPATVGASASAVDVMPLGISKRSGIKWLAESLGIPLSRVAVFGDAFSDLQMFSVAGISGAPSNASPDVLAKADFRAEGSDVSGLIEFIEYVTPKLLNSLGS